MFLNALISPQAKVWVKALSTKLENSFRGMRCFRDAVFRSIDRSEGTIKGFFDCKLQTLTSAETELKTWAGTAQKYLISISTQIKQVGSNKKSQNLDFGLI